MNTIFWRGGTLVVFLLTSSTDLRDGVRAVTGAVLVRVPLEYGRVILFNQGFGIGTRIDPELTVNSYNNELLVSDKGLAALPQWASLRRRLFVHGAIAVGVSKC